MKAIKPVFYSFFLVIPFCYTTLQLDPALHAGTLAILLYGVLFTIISPQALRCSFRFFYLPFAFVLTSFVAINVAEAMFKAVMLFACFYFVGMVRGFLRLNILSVKDIIQGITLSTILYLLIAGIQLLGFGAFMDTKSASSSLANENLLASLLYISAIVLVYRLTVLHNEPRKARLFSIILLIGMAVLVVFHQTKAVALGLIAAALLYPFLKKKLWLGVLVIVIASGVFAYLGLYVVNIGAESYSARLKLWDGSLDMISEHWWLGVGGGNWKIWFPKYGLNGYTLEALQFRRVFLKPHNEFLSLVCETGLLSVPFILMAMVWFRKRFTEHAFGATIALSMLASFAAVAFVDFPFERPTHIVFFGLTALLFVPKDSASPVSFPKILSLGLLLVCIISLGYRMHGAYHGLQAYRCNTSSNWQCMLRHSKAAQNPFFTVDALGSPVAWLAGIAQTEQQHYEEAIEPFRKASRHHPHHPRVLSDLGSAYTALEQYPSAIDCYLKALALSPDFETVRLNLAIAYYNSGNEEAAHKELDHIKRKTKSPQYIQLKKALHEDF